MIWSEEINLSQIVFLIKIEWAFKNFLKFNQDHQEPLMIFKNNINKISKNLTQNIDYKTKKMKKIL